MRCFCWMPCLCKLLSLASYAGWFRWVRCLEGDGDEASALLALRMLVVPYFLNGFQAAAELSMSVSCCPSRQRGLATSLFSVGGALAGSATHAIVGPVSDALAVTHSEAEALRLAMAWGGCSSVVVSVVAFAMASRTIREELASAPRFDDRDLQPAAARA